MSQSHGCTLEGSISRAVREWRYLRRGQWSLEEVGDFWDSVTDYDDVNQGTYSYLRRFSDSYELAADLVSPGSVTLDIQARTGNGTVFWAERGFVGKAYLVDFSEHMLKTAASRLSQLRLDFEPHLVHKFPLPFPEHSFDLVLSYETIEHIYQRASFVSELTRVLKPQGWVILTCPNVLWEPAHWISAILNIHHSEGPHRFLRRRTLLSLFASCGLDIVRENSTVFLPFSSELSTSTDRFLDRHLPDLVKRMTALRRTFVLRKAACCTP
ncbi:MAG TPA: class I SAM-dependent methyltransferase [Anaerolineae bacterium]|nr:class I SAM-dependent methyltransferase [Anaerolineae bacterium]